MKTKKKIVSALRKGIASLYENYRRNLPVEKGTVFYHAYRTRIMACNPYAIFLELQRRSEFRDFHHYWLYTHEDQLSYSTFSRFSGYENVHYVKFGSAEHLKALATCEYLICNAAMPDYWVKREPQIYINTWHGTPLKALGKSAKDMNEASISNARRNFYMSDYIVMPNQFTRNALFDSYDLRNMTRAKLVDAGYPRNDLCLNTDKKLIISLLEMKSGRSLEGKKIVLYAPTFRSVDGISLNDTTQTKNYLTELVSGLPSECEVFFKVHNTLSKFYEHDSKVSDRIILDEIETNELLSVCDILITDYSSIFFDFLCTGKPCIFFTYDRLEYEAERGMYIDMDKLPGRICDTLPELLDAVSDIVCGIYDVNEKYQQFTRAYAYHDDGAASQRVVDIIFNNDSSLNDFIEVPEQDSRKKIIINLGKADDALNIQTLLHVLRKIDPEQYIVIVCCEQISKLHFACKQFGSHIRLSSSKVKLSENDGYAKYFWDNVFDIFIEIDDADNDLERILIQSNIPKKIACMNNTDFGVQFIARHGSSYDEAYLIGEDQEGRAPNDPNGFSAIPSSEIRNSDPGRLNILFLSSFDSMNSVFSELIKELERRGHRSMVLVADKNDEIGNKFYNHNKISYYSVLEFRTATLNYIDLVVSAPLSLAAFRSVYRQIELHNIFTVTFATLFSSIAMRVFPDIVFCIGEAKVEEFRKNSLRYNFISSGNPQYDALSRRRRDTLASPLQVENVLIIDQGGYPFGAKGKKQLAECLIDIAKNNPDISFDIKPRYVRNERGRILHAVSEHLYDYFDEMPNNLHFIETPGILEEMVLEYDAMICNWSTAYLDALVLNMPLLLIEGFDSVDVFDVRNTRIKEAYDHLRATGCLVHYQTLKNKKLTFRYIDEDYAAQEVYQAKRPSSAYIVSCLEEIKRDLILNRRRFAGYFSVSVDAYKQILFPERAISFNSIDSPEYPALRTYRFVLNAFIQEAVFQNRCMGNILDYSRIEALYEPDSIPQTNDIELLRETLNAQFNQIFQEILSEYFTSEKGILAVRSDKIVQDYYFDWLFDTGRHHMLLSPDDEFVLLTPESRAYNMARYYLMRHRYLRAYRYLGEFLDQIKSSEYEMQLAKFKRLRSTLKPFSEKIKIFFLVAYLLLTKRYGVFSNINENTIAGNVVLTFFQMKDMNTRGKYEISKKIYTQYLKSQNQKLGLRKVKTAKQLIKSILLWPLTVLIKIVYNRTVRLSNKEKQKGENYE